MPKMKTHSASKQRFNLTKTGKVKCAKAYKSHILNKITTKIKRKLLKVTYICEAEQKNIPELIPYK